VKENAIAQAVAESMGLTENPRPGSVASHSRISGTTVVVWCGDTVLSRSNSRESMPSTLSASRSIERTPVT